MEKATGYYWLENSTSYSNSSNNINKINDSNYSNIEADDDIDTFLNVKFGKIETRIIFIDNDNPIDDYFDQMLIEGHAGKESKR